MSDQDVNDNNKTYYSFVIMEIDKLIIQLLSIRLVVYLNYYYW